MRRRASSVTSHAAMIKLFQKHRNIKYLENGLHRHATHVFLKYTSTGGYAKNPYLPFALPRNHPELFAALQRLAQEALQSWTDEGGATVALVEK